MFLTCYYNILINFIAFNNSSQDIRSVLVYLFIYFTRLILEKIILNVYVHILHVPYVVNSFAFCTSNLYHLHPSKYPSYYHIIVILSEWLQPFCFMFGNVVLSAIFVLLHPPNNVWILFEVGMASNFLHMAHHIFIFSVFINERRGSRSLPQLHVFIYSVFVWYMKLTSLHHCNIVMYF